jgi:hypothetical protein
MTAYEQLLDRCREMSLRVITSGRPNQVKVQCPVPTHGKGIGDKKPSLYITATDGMVLLHCQVGCPKETVLDAFGWTKRDLYDADEISYRYDNGITAYRKWNKKFRQERNGQKPELYRLSKVKAAIAEGRTVWFVAGEKDVHTLESLGEVGTTGLGGEGNLHLVDLSPLHNGQLIAIPDRDEPGARWAREAERRLRGKAKSLDFMITKVGKDISDHVEQGYGLADLQPAVPPEPDEPEPEPEPSSWRPVDLAPVLDGTWEKPQPTVGKRSDGRGLFYPTKTHTMIGEAEAGKGWAALSACADEMAAGNHVVYIDFEDDHGTVVDRLLTLGVSRTTIAAQFHYIRPEHPVTGRHLDELLDVLHTYHPTLVVVDGITEAMTLHGWNPLDNVDIALFNTRVVRRLTCTGAAQVSLDHVVKNGDNRGRYAIGGVHKLNIVSGASYILENRNPFGIGVTGRSTIKIAKDRPAQLRPYGLPSGNNLHWYGDLTLTSHNRHSAQIAIEPPQKHDSFQPTVLMEKISDYLASEDGPRSQNKMLENVRGKRDYLIEALRALVAQGYVTRDTPHSLIKPFQETTQ